MHREKHWKNSKMKDHSLLKIKASGTAYVYFTMINISQVLRILIILKQQIKYLFKHLDQLSTSLSNLK